MPDHIWFILIAIAIAALAVYLKKWLVRQKNKRTALRFTRLVLHESGCTAEENEYELIKNEKGVRISNYFGNWWDSEVNERSRKNCLAKRRGGGMELYNELAEQFGKLGIASWDGFDDTDPNVCDGGGFWLEIELEKGSIIHASGMNAYPANYHEFISILRGLFENKE